LPDDNEQAQFGDQIGQVKRIAHETVRAARRKRFGSIQELAAGPKMALGHEVQSAPNSNQDDADNETPCHILDSD
jgi:hypothetical protein